MTRLDQDPLTQLKPRARNRDANTFFSLAGADESSTEAAEQQQQQQQASSQAKEETAANNSEEDKENHASEAVAPPSAHNGTDTNGEAKQVYILSRCCNVG